jgi:sugar phosphate isomerase/epimerase
MISRRGFLGQASAAALYATTGSRMLRAMPLGLPLGIQLYSVRQELAKDYEGTLAAVAKAGYSEVESAGYYGHSASEVKAAMQKAKLRCVSAHHPMGDLQKNFDEILAFEKELGVQYIICSSASFKDATGDHKGKSLSIDDWRWNAEQFNEMGAKTAAVGIKFGYHNHVHEFAPTEGKVPYMELLHVCDPDKVTFELDCGWAIVAGMKPVELMRDHPHRFSMFHVKDFKIVPGATGEPKVTELGLGTIDYRPVFAQAAKNQKIRHMFVEQEAFDMPWQESLKTDAEYMEKLK